MSNALRSTLHFHEVDRLNKTHSIGGDPKADTCKHGQFDLFCLPSLIPIRTGGIICLLTCRYEECCQEND